MFCKRPFKCITENTTTQRSNYTHLRSKAQQARVGFPFDSHLPNIHSVASVADGCIPLKVSGKGEVTAGF
jgi:hypothetical protein